MATIVNTPGATRENGNGFGFLIGVILLAIVLFAFIYIGLPALRNMNPIQVNIPSKIDVNVIQPLPAPQLFSSDGQAIENRGHGKSRERR